MEVSATYAASTSRPMCFNRSISHSQIRSFAAIKTTDSIATGRNSKGRRKSIHVPNAYNEFTAPKHTLSSNWDVELCKNSTATSARLLPRFEELDPTNMLLRQRIVFLSTELNFATADFVISQLLLLDAADPKKDINFFINSPGGSTSDGMGIYDAMKLCRADISTICFGFASSMAAFLLACGTKGKRFCMPNARVMIHQPGSAAGGPIIDVGIRARELRHSVILVNKILSRITGKSTEQIEADTERMNFMNAWEAKEYGLVDGVIDDGKPGLVAPIVEKMPPPRPQVFDDEDLVGGQVKPHQTLYPIDKEPRNPRKNLPSEGKFLQKSLKEGEGSDDDKGPEQGEETPTAA